MLSKESALQAPAARFGHAVILALMRVMLAWKALRCSRAGRGDDKTIGFAVREDTELLGRRSSHASAGDNTERFAFYEDTEFRPAGSRTSLSHQASKNLGDASQSAKDRRSAERDTEQFGVYQVFP